MVTKDRGEDTIRPFRVEVPQADLDDLKDRLGRIIRMLEFFATSLQLLHGGTEVGLTSTDELGSFALRDIPPGVYDIVLSTDQEEISIATVDLSA
jgi:hypothetical protein